MSEPKKRNKNKIIEVAIQRNSKYEGKYDEMLIEHMATGLSFESFAGLIRVNKDTLYHWCSIYQTFSEAKKIGRQAQLLMDEQIIRDQAVGAIQGGSAAAQIFRMKNNHSWTDKQEIAQTTTTTTLTLEEYLKQQEEKNG